MLRIRRLRPLPLALILGLAVGAAADLPAYSGGLHGGGLMGRTDDTDEPSGTVAAFGRYTLGAGLEGEARVGYGRLSGKNFATDLVLLGTGLIYSFPTLRGPAGWQPLAHLGVLGIRHDIADYPPVRSGDAASIGWTAGVPVGAGVRRVLSPTLALEITGTYTYTLSDEFDGRTDVKGNDWLFAAGVSLVFGRFSPAPTRPAPVAPPAPAPATVPVDTDGDGLTDDSERRIHHTNPVMFDSDLDNLSDGDEVRVHRTNPNRPDSDGDGTDDGDEIAVGRNPLVSDAPPEPEPEPEPAPMTAEQALPLEMRTVSFASGGTRLGETARAILDRIAAHLLAHPQVELILRGYADAVGADDANLRLSGRRAEAVADYLVAAGVERWRLTTQAHGEADPVADNATPEGRRANRRVELEPRMP